MKISNIILQYVNEAVSKQLIDMGAFLKEYGDEYKSFLSDFNFAEKTLKKSNPASWFLKKCLIEYCCKIIIKIYKEEEEKRVNWHTYEQSNPQSNMSKIPNLIKKLERLTKKSIGGPNDVEQYYISTVSHKSISYLRQQLAHYFNYVDPRIKRDLEGYDYGNKDTEVVFADLDNIIKKWSEDPSNKYYVSEDDEKEEIGENKFIEYIVFPDGWKWIWKKTCKSDLESRYGNHCGTCDDSSHTMFSLREPSSEVEGMYKIWATFSIDEEGYLVQRKGVVEEKFPDGKIKKRKGNEKPEEHLYPYIRKLLEEGADRGDIKGLTIGSGYLSENDFSLSDLPEEEEKELRDVWKLDEKEYEDENLSLYDEYRYYGLSPRVIYRINNSLGTDFDDDSYDYKGHFKVPIDLGDFLWGLPLVVEGLDGLYDVGHFTGEIENLIENNYKYSIFHCFGSSHPLLTCMEYFWNEYKNNETLRYAFGDTLFNGELLDQDLEDMDIEDCKKISDVFFSVFNYDDFEKYIAKYLLKSKELLATYNVDSDIVVDVASSMEDDYTYDYLESQYEFENHIKFRNFPGYTKLLLVAVSYKNNRGEYKRTPITDTVEYVWEIYNEKYFLQKIKELSEKDFFPEFKKYS